MGDITVTIEECYQLLGGNYAEVMTRLPSVKLVEKFAVKFLGDDSYDTLVREMAAGNRQSAFRAAHTLKGVCANMSFTRLFQSASLLTEELRGDGTAIPDHALALLEDVKRDYDLTTNTIRSYAAGA